MYCTSGFDAESLSELKKSYVEYYTRSISDKDVGYLVYHHPSGMEVNFSENQRNEFIDDVNDMIDGAAISAISYDRDNMSARDFECKYRQYEKE